MPVVPKAVDAGRLPRELPEIFAVVEHFRHIHVVGR